MTFNVTVTVPVERVHNAIVGAFEGGSTYWLRTADFISGTPHDTPRLVWWGEQSVFEKPFSFKVEFDNPENMDELAEKVITQDDITTGLNVMAEKYPQHFSDLVKEEDDAMTHDVFIQCVIFGEIIYC